MKPSSVCPHPVEGVRGCGGRRLTVDLPGPPLDWTTMGGKTHRWEACKVNSSLCKFLFKVKFWNTSENFLQSASYLAEEVPCQPQVHQK